MVGNAKSSDEDRSIGCGVGLELVAFVILSLLVGCVDGVIVG